MLFKFHVFSPVLPSNTYLTFFSSFSLEVSNFILTFGVFVVDVVYLISKISVSTGSLPWEIPLLILCFLYPWQVSSTQSSQSKMWLSSQFVSRPEKHQLSRNSMNLYCFLRGLGIDPNFHSYLTKILMTLWTVVVASWGLFLKCLPSFNPSVQPSRVVHERPFVAWPARLSVDFNPSSLLCVLRQSWPLSVHGSSWEQSASCTVFVLFHCPAPVSLSPHSFFRTSLFIWFSQMAFQNTPSPDLILTPKTNIHHLATSFGNSRTAAVFNMVLFASYFCLPF